MAEARYAQLGPLLAAILAHLRTTMGLTADNCLFSLNPEELPASPGTAAGLTFCVSLTDGTFAKDLFDGGGLHQTTHLGGLTVVIHCPEQLDPAGRDEIALTDSEVGLSEARREVLKALTGYMPIDATGHQLTRNPLTPAAFGFGRNDRNCATASLQFHLEFDEDLYA